MGQFTSLAMRASMVFTSSFSPRWKNMPWLVRSSLTSSPPVLVATVSERLMRGLASAISASHSSSDSRPPNTTTRGSAITPSTATWRSPPSRYRGESPTAGSGTFTAGGRPCATACWFRWPRRVLSMASMATSSSQPEAFIDCSTLSALWPACAWSTIHWRSSGVICWVMVAG